MTQIDAKPDIVRPIPDQETVFESSTSLKDGKSVTTSAVQKSELDLRATWSLYSWRRDRDSLDPDEKYLLISFEGSKFHPGTLMADRNDLRGWFTEQVKLDVYFANDRDKVIFREKDSPETTTQTGDHSTSSGINMSVGGGFFGSDVTGNMDVGGSISNSFSESLADFKLVNNSSAHRMSHEYRLAMLGGGHPYAKPADVVEQDVGGWIDNLFKEGAAPGRLFNLPDRAVSNLPLVSQALFRAQRNLTKTYELTIELEIKLVMVEKTFVGVKIDFAALTRTLRHTRKIKIPFGDVD